MYFEYCSRTCKKASDFYAYLSLQILRLDASIFVSDISSLYLAQDVRISDIAAWPGPKHLKLQAP